VTYDQLLAHLAADHPAAAVPGWPASSAWHGHDQDHAHHDVGHRHAPATPRVGGYAHTGPVQKGVTPA
jgi:hypothetical protein